MKNRRPAIYTGGAGGELALVLDCADLERAAQFWGPALGYWWKPPEGPDDRYLALLPESGDGIELLLQRVPDRKTAKNRMHLDLRVRDLDAEVERLRTLGARRLSEQPIRESDWVWHILTDPDGNELCVLQPPEKYWTTNR